METKLVFKYDREGDILYINKRPPYPEQNSEELGDEVIARLNPKTGEIENLEVLFFSTRLLRNDLFELPIWQTNRMLYSRPSLCFLTNRNSAIRFVPFIQYSKLVFPSSLVTRLSSPFYRRQQRKQRTFLR
jgi:uncharacterized protein YuzE